MEAGTAKQNTTSVAVIDFVAGALGGTANVVVGQPLDTVKVRAAIAISLHSPIDCYCQLTIQKHFEGKTSNLSQIVSALIRLLREDIEI